jgi:hypothetical protein
MVERVSILDVKFIFQLPIQNVTFIGRRKLYFISGNSLAGLALVQFFFESFGFLFQFSIVWWFRGSAGFAERKLLLYLIVAKICVHQSAEQQDKGNRAQDDFENNMMSDNDAQKAEERRGATTPKNIDVLPPSNDSRLGVKTWIMCKLDQRGIPKNFSKSDFTRKSFWNAQSP